MITHDTWITIIIVILLLIIGAILWYITAALVRYIKLRLRFKKGRKGEYIARKYLTGHGFTIVSEQVARTAMMHINGTGHTYEVRADFLVKKKNRTGIVEVKTGNTAANPLSIPTRRQLFEYYHIFCVDVLYFFNADKRLLQEITFPLPE
jgi:Holliday junction resolvase-like predicted endonuclease